MANRDWLISELEEFAHHYRNTIEGIQEDGWRFHSDLGQGVFETTDADLAEARARLDRVEKHLERLRSETED